MRKQHYFREELDKIVAKHNIDYIILTETINSIAKLLVGGYYAIGNNYIIERCTKVTIAMKNDPAYEDQDFITVPQIQLGSFFIVIATLMHYSLIELFHTT